MKLYIILAAFIFIAAVSNSEYSKNEISGVYADTSLKCPVTGDDVSGEHTTFKYIDKEIRFCNDGCILAFKKEPSKYSEHLLCMPCGDTDAKKDINTVNDGVKYYFCGKGCKGEFEANPEAYLKKFNK